MSLAKTLTKIWTLQSAADQMQQTRTPPTQLSSVCRPISHLSWISTSLPSTEQIPRPTQHPSDTHHIPTTTRRKRKDKEKKERSPVTIHSPHPDVVLEFVVEEDEEAEEVDVADFGAVA